MNEPVRGRNNEIGSSEGDILLPAGSRDSEESFGAGAASDSNAAPADAMTRRMRKRKASATRFTPAKKARAGASPRTRSRSRRTKKPATKVSSEATKEYICSKCGAKERK